MKILVTGGTGYIGSHTVVELQAEGFGVVIVDNLSNSYAYVVDNIARISGIRPEFAHFDLTDEKLTARFFEQNSDIAAVIHFAACKSVYESVRNPLKYYHNNLGSLVNLLKNMELYGIRNLVFSSSCTVYGQPDELPVKETSPVKTALSPYGNTKRISEEIICDAMNNGEASAILLRYFNPIGAHESALIGELPIGIPDNLMPYITQTAIGKREFVNVFGTDYHTPDGTAIRDYLHVTDLAKAHVAALKKLTVMPGKTGTLVYNLGTGKGHSVLEVIHSFEKMAGIKLNYRLAGRRSGDAEKIWADTTLANRELGWKTEKTLDDMTLSAWKWEIELKKSGELR